MISSLHYICILMTSHMQTTGIRVCIYIQAIGTVMHKPTHERGSRGVDYGGSHTIHIVLWCMEHRLPLKGSFRSSLTFTDMYKYLLILQVNTLMWTYNRILSFKRYTELFNTLATCTYAKSTTYLKLLPTSCTIQAHTDNVDPLISVYSVCGYALYNNRSWAVANTPS